MPSSSVSHTSTGVEASEDVLQDEVSELVAHVAIEGVGRAVEFRRHQQRRDLPHIGRQSLCRR